MFDYNTQIIIFSFLDVQDISNILITSRLAYQSRNIIIRDIWFERYPQLHGLIEHNIFNMFYVDMVFEYLNTYNIDNIMKRLRLDDIPLNHESYNEQYTNLSGYDIIKSKVDRFSIVISRLQDTYDKLYGILANKLRDYEDEDDEEDFEMFISALMEYGHKIYRDIILSKNPYIDGTIDDDMVDERSNPIWFEEQDYGKFKIGDVTMIDISDRIFYDDPNQELLIELKDIEFQCDNMDEFEEECYHYNTIPDIIYDEQQIQIDRMQEILDRDPISAIRKILCLTEEHPDILDNIKDSILDYIDELLPNQIEKINDMIEE